MSKWFEQRNGGIDLDTTLFEYDGMPLVFLGTTEYELYLVVATGHKMEYDSYALFPITKNEFDTLKGTCWCFNHASNASLARNKKIELVITDHGSYYESRFMDEAETKDMAIGEAIDD